MLMIRGRVSDGGSTTALAMRPVTELLWLWVGMVVMLVVEVNRRSMRRSTGRVVVVLVLFVWIPKRTVICLREG